VTHTSESYRNLFAQGNSRFVLYNTSSVLRSLCKSC